MIVVLVSLALCIVGSNENIKGSQVLLIIEALLVLTIVCQWHFIINVVIEISCALKIKVFRVKPEGTGINKRLIEESPQTKKS